MPDCCKHTFDGSLFTPTVTKNPLRLATHRRLGEPLPLQLPNTKQAQLIANEFFLFLLSRIKLDYKVAFLFITHPYAMI